MTSNLPRLLPWSHWGEWLGCNQDFDVLFRALGASDADIATASLRPQYNDEQLESSNRALSIVSLWRARGRLPLTVDATAALFQARLTDANAASGDGSDSHSLRLQYSLAVTRLVNGLVEPLQQRQHAQSVAALALTLALPRVLVDIRHESTHASLPSLSVLRYASFLALQWLSLHYWSEQRALVQSLRSISVIESIIDEYEIAVSGGKYRTVLKKLAGVDSHSEGAASIIINQLFAGSGGGRALLPVSAYDSRSEKRLTAQFTAVYNDWMPLIKIAVRRFPSFQLDLLLFLATQLSDCAKESESEHGQLCLIQRWLLALLNDWKPLPSTLVVSLIQILAAKPATALTYSVLVALVNQREAGTTKFQRLQDVHTASMEDVNDSMGVDEFRRSSIEPRLVDMSVSSFLNRASAGQSVRCSSWTTASTESTVEGISLCNDDWTTCPIGVLPNEDYPHLAIADTDSYSIHGRESDHDIASLELADASEGHSSNSDGEEEPTENVGHSAGVSLVVRDWRVTSALHQWADAVTSGIQALS